VTDYAVLIPGDERVWESRTPEQRAATHAAHQKFVSALEERGHKITGGEELTHSRTARTLRRDGDRITVTDGPYAETTEQLGGFYVVSTDDPDALVDLSSILLEAEAAVEIRPCVDHSGDGS
jgi:hypothetical protein